MFEHTDNPKDDIIKYYINIDLIGDIINLNWKSFFAFIIDKNFLLKLVKNHYIIKFFLTIIK